MQKKNEKLISDFGATRRQSRSLYRNWAVISKKSLGNSLQSQSNGFAKISASSIKNDCAAHSRESSNTLIEERADEIFRHLEQSLTLMDDNPKSNNDRIETLRDMTEYLTLKRSVKRKLSKSIVSTNHTLGFSKRLKYRISLFFFKPFQLNLIVSFRNSQNPETFALYILLDTLYNNSSNNNNNSNQCLFLKIATVLYFFPFITLLLFVLVQVLQYCLTESDPYHCSNSDILRLSTAAFDRFLSYLLCISYFAIKHFISSFELWYSSLKVIEGHFGSNVASYFKFLRKLFLLNACIFFLMLFFIMMPQLLFRLFQYVDDNQNFNSTLNFSSTKNETTSLFTFFGEKAKVSSLIMAKANPYEENDEFRLGNLITGEGFLTNTILFYGYYTNTSLQLIKGHIYNIPAAYFFTSAVCFIIIFFFLFTSVAVSYRKCYIETSGSMHNTFTNKVFCGWDFGIATRQAAELKSKSIYIELKELLDDLSKPKKSKSWLNTFYTTAISFSLNGLLIFLLCLGGMYSWKFLDQQMTKADTATTMMMWLILTLVIAVAPVLFSLIAHLEGFESPSTALYMTLLRTFALYAIVIAVVVAYRLNRSNESECWETILGQDMFRLVVLDFIFGSIGTTLSEFIRYRIFTKMWKGIGCPEFDIARSTMNLIYNQTLFYVGLFFSPVLSLLITVKLLLIFFVKKWGAIYNCKPFVKPWRASQAHTVYLSIAFLAFFCVLIACGYIVTSVKTSNCGPFRGEKFMYERLLEEVLSNKNSSVLMVFYYVTRPGVVGIVLMAMVLGVYYMRAVALARIHVVKHLQYLLRLKAEDRKLLLTEISKYTKNRDPTDDSAVHNILNYKSSSRNLPESVKKERMKDEFCNSEQLKMTKYDFSSMNNLQCEKGTYSRNQAKRNNIFNSIQNITSCSGQDSIELKYKFDRSKCFPSEDFEENLCEKCRISIYESEKSCKHISSKNQSSCSDSDVPQNKIYAEIAEGQCGARGVVGQFSFNPIFTESIPLNFDDTADYEDTINTIGIIESSRDSEEEEKSLAEENEKFPTQNINSRIYLANEERLPSRITFLPDQKTSVTKKHH